jgi:hypothetical protein
MIRCMLLSAPKIESRPAQTIIISQSIKMVYCKIDMGPEGVVKESCGEEKGKLVC